MYNIGKLLAPFCFLLGVRAFKRLFFRFINLVLKEEFYLLGSLFFLKNIAAFIFNYIYLQNI